MCLLPGSTIARDKTYPGLAQQSNYKDIRTSKTAEASSSRQLPQKLRRRLCEEDGEEISNVLPRHLCELQML